MGYCPALTGQFAAICVRQLRNALLYDRVARLLQSRMWPCVHCRARTRACTPRAALTWWRSRRTWPPSSTAPTTPPTTPRPRSPPAQGPGALLGRRAYRLLPVLAPYQSRLAPGIRSWPSPHPGVCVMLTGLTPVLLTAAAIRLLHCHDSVPRSCRNQSSLRAMKVDPERTSNGGAGPAQDNSASTKRSSHTGGAPPLPPQHPNGQRASHPGETDVRTSAGSASRAAISSSGEPTGEPTVQPLPESCALLAELLLTG